MVNRMLPLYRVASVATDCVIVGDCKELHNIHIPIVIPWILLPFGQLMCWGLGCHGDSIEVVGPLRGGA